MHSIALSGGANGAGIKEVNKMLKRFGCPTKISTVRSKYLNNMIEQDHRFIKRRTRPMLALYARRGSKTARFLRIGVRTDTIL